MERNKTNEVKKKNNETYTKLFFKYHVSTCEKNLDEIDSSQIIKIDGPPAPHAWPA